jgi:hypothetical protein
VRLIGAAAARAALLAGLVAFALWVSADSLPYRWNHGPLADLYHATHRHVGPIDLAVVGSSRSQFAFDAFRFERAWEARHGGDVVVLDLSKEFRGPALEYLMLRRLFEARPVRHVLAEYQNGYGRDQLHPDLHLAASFGEIAEVCWAQEHRPAWKRAQRIVDLWIRKASGSLALAAQGELVPVEVDPEALRPAETRDPTRPRVQVRPRSLTSQAHRADWRAAPPRVWDFDAPDAWPDRHYAHAIVELARAHGAEVTFWAPSWIYEPPLDDAVVAAFERRFGAPLLQLPPERLAEIYPDGFADLRHMNAHGAEVWMDWLAAHLDLAPGRRP